MYQSEENVELTRAADAVHSILNAGSFVCTYNLQGNTMLGIKYSEAMRKLYGYSSEDEFPDLWSSWMDCVLPEDRSYVEGSYLTAVKDHTGQTLYDVTYRARQKDGTIRWLGAEKVGRHAHHRIRPCHGYRRAEKGGG